MTDDVKAALTARVAKAEDAKRDLALVKPRLEAMREGYLHVWRTSGHADVQRREQAWLGYQAVDAVERDFKSQISDGQAAAFEIEKMGG